MESKPGQIIPWNKLFFPQGCGRTPGGVPSKPLPKPKPKPQRPIDSTGQTSNPSPGVVYPGQGKRVFI